MYSKLSMIFSFFSIFPQDMAFHWHVKPPQCPGWTCSTEAIGNSQHFVGIQWEYYGGNHISSESFSKHRSTTRLWHRDISQLQGQVLVRGCYDFQSALNSHVCRLKPNVESGIRACHCWMNDKKNSLTLRLRTHQGQQECRSRKTWFEPNSSSGVEDSTNFGFK